MDAMRRKTESAKEFEPNSNERNHMNGQLDITLTIAGKVSY